VVTCTTSVKGAGTPAANVAVVQLMVPVPPGAGVLHTHPAGTVRDTYVVLAGTASVKVTFWDGEGPLLVAVMVY
jgi:hypothetical protein